MEINIAVIPGDGIGVDVIREGVKALEKVASVFNHTIHFRHFLAGGSCIDVHGVPLLESSIAEIRQCDAILFGAVGGPKWDNLPSEIRPEKGLGLIRRSFDLYANLRPSKIYQALEERSPLKSRVLEQGMDLMIIRDLTGGMYYGTKGLRTGSKGLEAFDTECYSEMEIERILRKAFEMAQSRRKKLVSADKSNALESSRLWRKTANRLAEEYPDVELKNVFVDKMAMEIASNPAQYDVVVTTCMFGDILSDIAAVATGSIGMLPSASLGSGNFGLFEPIHGTAPDIAGKGIANPLATIAAVTMLLDIGLGLKEEAAAVDRAIERVLADGYRTRDIFTEGYQLVDTEAMGTLTVDRIKLD